MDRPVSPVQPDEELLSSTGVNSDGVSFTRGVDGESAVDEDDREMAWILEEERKARERREQAGRLPTTR